VTSPERGHAVQFTGARRDFLAIHSAPVEGSPDVQGALCLGLASLADRHGSVINAA
jgi:hypothetical protein